MGVVNFDTNVVKDVDIDVDIDLDIVKNVSSFVDIVGNLATAEASADAFGSGGGNGTPGTGEPVVFFLLDAFDSSLLVEADPAPPPPDATNPASGSVDLLDSESDFPDGTERSVTVNVTSGDGTSSFESGASGGNANFSNASTNVADFDIVYDLSATTDVLNGANPDTAFLHISAAGSDEGETLTIVFTDSDGTVASVDREIDPDTDGSPQSFDVPLSDFLDAASGGSEPGLDFTEIDQFELLIDGELTADTFLDDLSIQDTPPPGGGGTLAETETFAQAVEGVLSQSFSMSTAAAGGAGTGDDMIEPIG